jgi:hypothetical protein
MSKKLRLKKLSMIVMISTMILSLPLYAKPRQLLTLSGAQNAIAESLKIKGRPESLQVIDGQSFYLIKVEDFDKIDQSLALAAPTVIPSHIMKVEPVPACPECNTKLLISENVWLVIAIATSCAAIGFMGGAIFGVNVRK